VRRNPRVKSSDDLRGLVVGIQVGNTSDLVARRLLARGATGDIKYYPYHGIITALDDLSAGRIGALIKLFPVISWLVKDRGELSVIEQVPTHEELGMAFARSNTGLCQAVNESLERIKKRGEFEALRSKWFDELRED
jgi:polar amino acid transport system substrate-binding protein